MHATTRIGVAVSARSSQRAAGRRLCALTLLFVAAAASAQVAENITVNYVEVPVTVVDRSGNAIRGLTKANFEITDEGKKRAIAGFDAVDFASARHGCRGGDEHRARRAAQFPARLRPEFLVANVDQARAGSGAAVRDEDGGAVRTASGSPALDVAHGFRLLTSFTTDRAARRSRDRESERLQRARSAAARGKSLRRPHRRDDGYEDANGGGRPVAGPDLNRRSQTPTWPTRPITRTWSSARTRSRTPTTAATWSARSTCWPVCRRSCVPCAGRSTSCCSQRASIRASFRDAMRGLQGPANRGRGGRKGRAVEGRQRQSLWIVHQHVAGRPDGGRRQALRRDPRRHRHSRGPHAGRRRAKAS